MSSPQSISEQVIKMIGNAEMLTFYKVSQIASEITHKNVRPQQVRNYMMNGLIKWVETTDGRRIPREAAEAWLTKYCTKHAG